MAKRNKTQETTLNRLPKCTTGIEGLDEITEGGLPRGRPTLIRDISERKRAEEELRKASLYARSLIEASLDPLVTISSDGKITDVNQATEQVTGITRNRLIGSDFSDYFTEPLKAREGYQRVLTEGLVRDYPLSIRHISGRITDVLYNATIYRNEAGEVQGVFAAARDITERKKAEEALRLASAYNRSLIEASLDPLVTIGSGGRITDVNVATEKVTGHSREKLIGTDFMDYFSESEKAKAGYQQVFQDGFVQDYALEIRHKDGHLTPVLYNASVYRDEAGSVIGVFAAARDITERRRAEEELRKHREHLEELVEERTAELRKANEQLQQEIMERKRAEESQAQLAAIVESSDDAIIGKTLDGIIFSWNSGAEKLYGYSSEEMKNRSISILLPPNRPDEMPMILARIKHGENIKHYETIRIRKDGSIIYVSLTTSPIKDMAGNIIGASTIARDVTERKRAEEEIKKLDQELKYQIMQLEAANKELEAFSYSVSHDLRAPLRAIDGFSRVMLEDYIGKLDDEGKRYLNIIRSNTQKMGQLIDDLLVFSRLGRQEIRISGIDMGKLAKAVSEELKLAVPGRKLKFAINTLIPAQGDQAMIRQVFVNLLSNAVKFTKPKERALIEVDGRSEGNENVYTVKDNGVGFDMQYVNKLFGVFQRLHSSEEFEGTGVGLAIVQRIIHRHGGRVWAEGKVGEGAIFYFSLPAK